MADELYGYNGQLIRVNLTEGQSKKESMDEATLRECFGGTGLGVKILYDEVPPSVGGFDSENKMIFASGPLGGTRIGGSGTYSVVTVGALTNGVATSQANGYFGAFLRFSGLDGLVIEGASPDWVYLYIHEGQVEIRDAKHLLGKSTFETEDAIKAELNLKEREMSVAAIGPAGENKVRFAMISSDRGHVAAHNGIGAVMGSKKLKAIAVARKGDGPKLKDPETITKVSKELLEIFKRWPECGGLDNYHWGTLQSVPMLKMGCMLPVKNYTTAVWDISDEELGNWTETSIRDNFADKRKACWACQFQHCFSMKIKEGPYAGTTVEEPEYEGLAACGPLIGNTEVTGAMVLNEDIDLMGMDVNEAGWVLSFVMECYEKGILSKEQFGGLEMTWGNVEAARVLVAMIARREGIGDVLAEGVMRAAQKIGGEARDLAIHTMKGNTPRSHDHRMWWLELLDTCVSNCGTIEDHMESIGQFPEITPPDNPLGTGMPDATAGVVAGLKGSMQFQDSLGVCHFNTGTRMELLCRAVNAATGWDIDRQEALKMGRRVINMTRIFNLKRGIGAELDRPSPRYGSAPVDGHAAGLSAFNFWDQMLEVYYEGMGWDKKTGVPLPETLQKLGIGHLSADLP